MATNTNTPIVWTEDGPRLILADGSVVMPFVGGGDSYVTADQGSAVYETGGGNQVGISFVDDPDAEDHEEVQEVLEEYGF